MANKNADHDLLLQIAEHVGRLPGMETKLEALTTRVAKHGTDICWMKWVVTTLSAATLGGCGWALNKAMGG
jgi:hypothetical protein